MSDFPLTPQAVTRYDTTSHHTERLNDPAANDPYRFNWRNVHGTSLGQDFKLALKKLEGIMYVLSGGQPDYAGGQQWWAREHPRCRWLVEQLEEQPGDTGPNVWNHLETAALGHVKNGYVPDGVAVRSRSGDPRAQFKRAQHTDYFPFDSVERTDGHEVHDPASTFKQFPVWPDSEDVVVTYTEPTGKSAIEVRLVNSLGQNVSMDENPAGVWKATIPSQTQGTWVDWYLRGIFSDDPANFHYDPFVGTTASVEDVPVFAGAIADPEHDRADDAAYSFVFYSHFNVPYKTGLPELLDENEPHEPGNWLRRCTDAYLFDDSANIQPGLINLVRFVLDSIGLRFVQHSPGSRPGADSCCFAMPIIWRWTGTNTPDRYVEGGKGGVNSTQPLHNHPNEPNPGDQAARRSWRGADSSWDSNSFFFDANYDFGDDESWLSWPWELKLDERPDDPGVFAQLHKYGERGLLPGNSIDPIHVQEIIDAVEYLMSNGLVMKAPIHTAPYSSSSVWGVPCGYRNGDSDACPQDIVCGESVVNESQCCESWIQPGYICVPWTAPAWANCNAQSKCYTNRSTSWRLNLISWRWQITTNCRAEEAAYSGEAPAAAASFRRFGGYIGNGWTDCEDCSPSNCNSPLATRGTNEYGATYYLCGPPQELDGPIGDSLHGNGFAKSTRQNFNQGPSMGNRFAAGSVFSCGAAGPGAPDPNFNAVTAVVDDGVATSWYRFDQPATLSTLDTSVPDIPGTGLGAPFVEFSEDPLPNCPGVEQILTASIRGEPACDRTTVYVTCDMNLLANNATHGEVGIPNLFDYNLNIASPYDDCVCGTYRGPSC